MKTHPFPLPLEALHTFCHPHPGHIFAQPVRHGTEILAGNAYIALRVRKGNWIDADFPEASIDFLTRFDLLPWNHYLGLIDSKSWTYTHVLESTIFRRPPIRLWMSPSHPYKLTPSPIWAIRDIKVRLSHLQLIALLPRCEIYDGPPPIASSPLFFRFSGGIGIIAYNPTLASAVPSNFILQPAIAETVKGNAYERTNTPPVRLTQPGVNWPPVDTSEI